MDVILLPLIFIFGFNRVDQPSVQVFSVRRIYFIQLAQFLVFVLFTAFLIYKHFVLVALASTPGFRYFIGNLFSAAALIVVLLNVYKIILRPLVHRLRFGTLEIYQPVHAVPLTGSLLIMISTLIYPPSVVFGVIALTLYLADPMGLAWHNYELIKLLYSIRCEKKAEKD